ncbi:hypothetical protein FRC00_003213 [Tulasnella sp. 408]|nr:hypothetical protein FRC00_003213 [Tulasnella sp. 408]
MTSIPRARRPVIGTSTEGDVFATGLIPFYIVLSNAPAVFLVPAFVLFSTTPPPPHPTPVPALPVFDPLKPWWFVSYEMSLNDETTLHNMAIGRPLNGTGKCVTKKVFTLFDPKEFAASPFSEDVDAPVEARVYSIAAPVYVKRVPSRMLDLTAWELVSQVGLLESPAITRVFPETRYVLIPSPSAQNDILRHSEQFASIFKRNVIYSTVVGVFKLYRLIVTLVLLVVLFHLAPLVIRCLFMLKNHLTFSRRISSIVKPPGFYRPVLILARTIGEGLWSIFKGIVVALAAAHSRAVGIMRPKVVPECLFTHEEAEVFRKAHGDSIPVPTVPLVITKLRQNNAFILSTQKKTETVWVPSSVTLYYQAIEKRLKRDEPPLVEPSPLSPLGVKLAKARSLLSQIEIPFIQTPDQPAALSTPPITADEAQEAEVEQLQEGSKAPRPPMKKITPNVNLPAHGIALPRQTFDESWLLARKPPGEHPDRPAKQEAVKIAASRISPSNTFNGRLTASLGSFTVIDPMASSATRPKPTEQSSAAAAKGKNKQDPTPAPSEPSEHANSGAGLAGQVSEEIFDESPLETPSATKNTSQGSNLSGSRRSDVRPAAQVSGAGSNLRTLK